MTTIEIPERDLYFEYPSSWEELSDKQFSFVMQNWIKLMNLEINIDEFNVIILYNLLGIKRSPFDINREKRMSKQQLEDKFANIWQLTLTLGWLIRVENDESNKPVGVINYTGIENRFPFIDNTHRTFQGPADCLLDISFGEYRAAWKHFEAYSRSRADDDLNMLIASLYRPVAGTETNRTPFDNNKVKTYAKELAEIPFWQKYAICLWFGN